MHNELQQKDRELIWHPYTSLLGAPDHIVIESASGIYLHASDGRKIIDAVSSWWVNIHGHCHPYISEAIARQARTMDHIIFAGFTHEPAIRLAERLLPLLPGEQKKIFYSDNGSTAVEVGLKMAIQYWYNQGKEKKKIIALEGAYHGDTFGAMSAGERGAFTKPFQGHLFDVEFVAFPKDGSEAETVAQFERLAKQGDLCAFIYEPLVQGASGMRIYNAEVLGRLLKTAREHEVVCIADEVMTGFGRTGKLFASQHVATPPDIICLSKGITGGVLPLGATTCNARILEAFQTEDKLKTLFHGHSFTGNSIACAVANASLDLLLRPECQENIRMINEHHLAFLPVLKKIPGVADAKVLGTILSVEIKTPESTGYFNSLRDQLYHAFLEKDILIRPLGNIIYIIPPYVIDRQSLEKIYRIFEEILIHI